MGDDPTAVPWDGTPAPAGSEALLVNIFGAGPLLVCRVCGTNRDLVIHRKDGDPLNGDLDNLIVGCPDHPEGVRG